MYPYFVRPLEVTSETYRCCQCKLVELPEADMTKVVAEIDEELWAAIVCSPQCGFLWLHGKDATLAS